MARVLTDNNHLLPRLLTDLDLYSHRDKSRLHLHITKYNSNTKMLFQLFQFKRLGDQVGPCPRKGQGHPRILTHIIDEVLETPMQHTEFQNSPLIVSEMFFKVFSIYGHGGHLIHVTLTA